MREVRKSHLNYMVADTEKWEQSAGYYLDRHPAVEAWVKNAGLAFAIPYFHNGHMHDYVPDFIVRLKSQAPEAPLHATLETKGFDPLEEVKGAAAERWVAAVTADARFGTWRYHVIRRPPEIDEVLASLDRTAGRPGV